MAVKMRKFDIDFVGKFKWASSLSLVLVIASLILVFTKGLNFGVDFKGGAEIQVKMQSKVELEKLRTVLAKHGFTGALVQSIGPAEDNEYLIKVLASEKNLNETTDAIGKAMQSAFADQGAEVRRTDIVGPKAGAELRFSGFQAMIWAIIAIMIYIGLRFDFKYAPGAIIALFHDVIVILGIFVLTQKEFTLQIVAAILAVIGYSVNDTVVIYDRVREHEEKYAGLNLVTHINNAINETLSRTMLTSLTTLFVTLGMLFWGGLVIRDFFFALTMGIIFGTYSTVFVASPVTLLFEKFFNKESESRKKFVESGN